MSQLIFGEQCGGIISVAAVGKKCYDHLTLVLRSLCQLNCAVQGCARGNTNGDTLLLCQKLCGSESCLVGSLDDLIVDLGVQYVRYETCADALDLMCASLALGKYGGGFRLLCNNLYVGILRL